MDLFLLLGTGVYFCFVVIIFSGLLFRKRLIHPESDLLPVSVVISARNEEKNISNLLNDLVNQSVDKNQLEILIANDRSDDGTGEIIDRFASDYSFIKTIHINKKHTMAPKKYALTQAINNSNGEIIIATDADCRVPSNWVKSMGLLVQATGKIVIGYSKIGHSKTLINEFQKIDFLGIMAANGGLLTHGIVCSGSGQNLAYKKEDFYKINGFEPVKDQTSGDDMYMVQTISSLKGAIFNYDPDSFVSTLPKKSILGYLNQRVRWSSNSKSTFKSNPLFFGFLLSAFIANCCILYSIIVPSSLSIFLFTIKFFLEAFVIFIGSRLFLTSVSIIAYIIWNLVQPIYIPIVGISGLIGKYSWKE
ncbi:MAG: glycosyltransferase [Candidatus Marinimicrobia bacterium]|nr:glycosyltransferase [Candidatus Neomarinimicrobiota bacterium]